VASACGGGTLGYHLQHLGRWVPARTDSARDPRREPLPPHLIDMIRPLYGVELTVRENETDVHVNAET